MTELRNIQKSLSSGEKEKAELMQSLAQLKDELTRLQLCEGSPEASTLSLPQEKLSTASQTDLSGELVPIGTRLAEMARMRLQYDEARKRIQLIQQQLADLEEKVGSLFALFARRPPRPRAGMRAPRGGSGGRERAPPARVRARGRGGGSGGAEVPAGRDFRAK